MIFGDNVGVGVVGDGDKTTFSSVEMCLGFHLNLSQMLHKLGFMPI